MRQIARSRCASPRLRAERAAPGQGAVKKVKKVRKSQKPDEIGIG
jgi:hypothetical protein